MNFGIPIESYEGKTIGIYGGKFLPFHKGHLSCIMEAQSLVDILFVVVGYDDEYDKQLCQGTRFKWVSGRVRERWISEELKRFDNIRVTSQFEPRSDDYMNDAGVFTSTQSLIKQVGGKVDVVFSSENEYQPYFEKYFPGAHHQTLDPERKQVNVSATEVRDKGITEMWDYLPNAVQKHYVKRFAICGIESAGKTHLLKMLSSYYNTIHVEEYGRLYYDDLNSYTDVALRSDYEDIAAGHLHIMNQLQGEANRVMLIDTDLIYTQYFHIREFGEMNPVLDAIIKANAEKIEAYIYIEPHNYHELDGTRRPVEDETRKGYNGMLKDLYAYYERSLIVIDEPERLPRFDECLDVTSRLLKDRLSQIQVHA